MTLTEFAEILQKQLEVLYQPNLGTWQATFIRGEIKRPGTLLSEYGSGKTPGEALANYVAVIRGKTLVFNAHLKDRTEHGVPRTLTA